MVLLSNLDTLFLGLLLPDPPPARMRGGRPVGGRKRVLRKVFPFLRDGKGFGKPSAGRRRRERRRRLWLIHFFLPSFLPSGGREGGRGNSDKKLGLGHAITEGRGKGRETFCQSARNHKEKVEGKHGIGTALFSAVFKTERNHNCMLASVLFENRRSRPCRPCLQLEDGERTGWVHSRANIFGGDEYTQ